MNLSLEGKIAVVTGAAKGIGRSIAERLAESGAAVGIIDFDRATGAATQDEFTAKGYNCVFVAADVSSYESMLQARRQLIEAFGKIDILVINAGVSRKHSIAEIDAAEWERVISINLSGSFYTVKAFYDCFAKKTPADNGRIIFITSGSGITGTGGGAHYASSKSGQHGLMRTVSKELGKNGVSVNAIAPRVIVTDLFDTLYPTEESKEKLVSQIPIGRFGYPEDIANLACFLAAPESSYIHGQIILMDGGRTY
ncbi:MAG: SDR family NAD(P)-dependent oxidoreductase [Eubacteriales bacterium]|nr:SDR family NAD(P)-dependent oxidoreductase [Eubacteriales bacterium]